MPLYMVTRYTYGSNSLVGVVKDKSFEGIPVLIYHCLVLTFCYHFKVGQGWARQGLSPPSCVVSSASCLTVSTM